MYFHCVFEVSACVTSIGEDRKRGSRRPACERSEFRQFKLDCISIFVKTLDMKAVNTKVDETLVDDTTVDAKTVADMTVNNKTRTAIANSRYSYVVICGVCGQQIMYRALSAHRKNKDD